MSKETNPVVANPNKDEVIETLGNKDYKFKISFENIQAADQMLPEELNLMYAASLLSEKKASLLQIRRIVKVFAVLNKHDISLDTIIKKDGVVSLWAAALRLVKLHVEWTEGGPEGNLDSPTGTTSKN